MMHKEQDQGANTINVLPEPTPVAERAGTAALICRLCGSSPSVVHFAASDFCGECFCKVSADLFGRR